MGEMEENSRSGRVGRDGEVRVSLLFADQGMEKKIQSPEGVMEIM